MAKIKGIHAPHCKNTANLAPEVITTPPEVRLPMVMHAGSPAVPVVAVGDAVKVGQLIAEAGPRVSSPIHSGVSGTVKSIDEFDPITGEKATSIVITTDGKQEVCENLKPPVVENLADFLSAVQNSGVVGLGGAGYPTGPKLTLKEGTNLEYILINGAECEPYITSDTRTMVDDAKNAFNGALLLMKYMQPKEIVFVIEDNKPEAIAAISALCKTADGIRVEVLPSEYPQGERKIIIHNVIRRVVPEGGRLTDVGCMVLNCTTVAVISRFIETGMPLTHRIVTVDGAAVKQSKNLLVPIGTPIKHLFEHCGGLTGDVKKVIMGGPMMGKAVPSLDMPITKVINSVLALTAKEAKLPKETACIKCGRCIEKCPMRLMPSHIEDAYEQKDIDRMNVLKVNLCAECGCCAYLCPARRPLAQVMVLSKNMQWEAKQK